MSSRSTCEKTSVEYSAEAMMYSTISEGCSVKQAAM